MPDQPPQDPFEMFRRLSAPYGTRLATKDGLGVIEIG